MTPDPEPPAAPAPDATIQAGPIPPPGTTGAYRVLARKYRPATFDALIGQEVLVRTLRNAIDSGRLAQAWMLTGVRGVGKTTTARLIARALNCIGPDGRGGVTISPCGRCTHCRAIAEDRHVDVLEMDAASRTGVNDVRDILDGVRYRPTSARTKVYIIDEVHMLSTPAFNALLKTLEEPPEHVKFIFATTELRKVPVTVLSRCQRFDLRRVDAPTLSAHFARIAETEGATVEPAALALIARAADGSVRDGLSLLDQAIAHAGGPVTEAQVASMLGLADRGVILDLLDHLLTGRPAPALDLLAHQYAMGVDPLVVLQDLLDLVHWMTRVKVVPASAEDASIPEADRKRALAMADRLSMAILNRAWQILLKGLDEARDAPVPLSAVEMGLIRLAYAANLPTPDEALKALIAGGSLPPPPGGGLPPRASDAAPAPVASSTGGTQGGDAGVVGAGGGVASATETGPNTPTPPAGPTAALSPFPAAPPTGLAAAPKADSVPAPAPAPALAPPPTAAADGTPCAPAPPLFADLVDQIRRRREAVLAAHLTRDIQLVRYDPQAAILEFHPLSAAPRTLAGRLGSLLQDWTGRRWMVSVTDQPGEPTLQEQTEADIQSHPLVRAALEVFPKATLGTVRVTATADAAGTAPPADLGTASGFAPDAVGTDPDSLADDATRPLFDPDDAFDPFTEEDAP